MADIRPRLAEIRAHLEELYIYARQGIEALGIRVNAPAGERASHIINVTLPNIKSETALHFLSADGVFVSSGSACSSHSKIPSGTLIAFGLTPADADCSLRISFSEYNTPEEIDALRDALSAGIDTLVRIRR